MITVQNNRSGVVSEMSQAHFDSIKDTPQWKGVFSVVEGKEVAEPEEVTAMKKAKIKPAPAADSSQGDNK